MLHRDGLRSGERVVITGASGGVGSAAVRLARDADLLASLERDEIRPLVAQTFALADIAAAQSEFLEKRHVGKFVLSPPAIKQEIRS